MGNLIIYLLVATMVGAYFYKKYQNRDSGPSVQSTSKNIKNSSIFAIIVLSLILISSFFEGGAEINLLFNSPHAVWGLLVAVLILGMGSYFMNRKKGTYMTSIPPDVAPCQFS